MLRRRRAKEKEKKKIKKTERLCQHRTRHIHVLFICLLFSFGDDFPSAQACVCRHAAAQAQLALLEKAGGGELSEWVTPATAPVG